MCVKGALLDKALFGHAEHIRRYAMIKVGTGDPNRVLAPELSVSWIDLTTKELKVAENTKDNVTTIGLEVIQNARKTPVQLLLLASIAIATEVSEQYSDDALLEPAICAFVNENVKSVIEQCDRYVRSSLENTRLIDFTSIRHVDITINERVQRDDKDEVVSSSVVAKIEGDKADYVYSSAGVFDRFEAQPDAEARSNTTTVTATVAATPPTPPAPATPVGPVTAEVTTEEDA